MQQIVQRMATENVAAPGTPRGIIEYLDFSDQKDNSQYVADLEKGLLQPVEVFDEDLWLSQIDLENIVQEAEDCTKNCVVEPGKKEEIAETEHFGESTSPDTIESSQHKR